MNCYKKTLNFLKKNYEIQVINPSPWPLLISFSPLALFFATLVHCYVPEDSYGLLKIHFIAFCLFFYIYKWYCDIKANDFLSKLFAIFCLYFNWLVNVLILGMVFFKKLLFIIVILLVIILFIDTFFFCERYKTVYFFLLIHWWEICIIFWEISKRWYPRRLEISKIYYWLLIIALLISLTVFLIIFLYTVYQSIYFLKRLKKILKQLNNELQIKIGVFTVIWFIWFYYLKFFIKIFKLYPQEFFYFSKPLNFLILISLSIILLCLAIEITTLCKIFFTLLKRIYIVIEKKKITPPRFFLKFEILLFKFLFWYCIISWIFFKICYITLLFWLKLNIFY